jgi:hypothetical protein
VRSQERIKFKRGINEPMKPWKVSSMFNLVNQQNPKMNNGSKEQATLDLTWKKINKNSGINKYLSQA